MKFNLVLDDLFYFIEKTEVYNFADDNTLYSCGTNIYSILSNAEDYTTCVLEWFNLICLKANPCKLVYYVKNKLIFKYFFKM